jgi:hypothetical protein
MAVRLTPAVERSLEKHPHLVRLTKHLSIEDVRMGSEWQSALDIFFDTLTEFPAIFSLSVSDDVYRVKVVLPKSPKWHGWSATLTHLSVLGSTPERLACLLAALPNLISLRSELLCRGRLEELPVNTPTEATCKLQEVYLRAIISFDIRCIDEILGSSINSLKAFTLADCSRFMVGILDYLSCTAVKQLTLKFSDYDLDSRLHDLDRLAKAITNITSLTRVRSTCTVAKERRSLHCSSSFTSTRRKAGKASGLI